MAKPIKPPTAAALKAIGISKSYASELLSGKKMPSFRMAKRIEEGCRWPVTKWPMEAASKETI